MKTPITIELKGDTTKIFSNQWEREFFAKLSTSDLIQLVEVANFMDIPKLVDACCAQIAIIMKTSTQKELEDKFGIDLNMTLQEEDDLKKEFSWAMEMDL